MWGWVHCDGFVFVGEHEFLEVIAEHMADKPKVKVARTGHGAPGLRRSIRLTKHRVIYLSDHRHAHRLIEELQLGRQQIVVTSASRESRMARNKEEELEREGGVGKGASPGKLVLAEDRSVGSRVKTGRGAMSWKTGVRKNSVGGETHTQTSARQTGACRAGVALHVRANPGVPPWGTTTLELSPLPEKEPPGIGPWS